MYHIEFVEFLGEVRNNTGINGKSFIFRVVDTAAGDNFEAILFVHPDLNPFVTVEEHRRDDTAAVRDKILEQFKLEELLAYEN